jgi:hypothetical protein
MMQSSEPTLQDIEDYNTKGSKEKRLTVWIVILSGLLVGAIYSIISANTSVSDTVASKEKTGIIKY